MPTMEEKLAEIKRLMAAKRKEPGLTETKPTNVAQVDTNASSDHGFDKSEGEIGSAHKSETKLQSKSQNTDTLSQDSDKEQPEVPLLPKSAARKRNFLSELDNTNNTNLCPTAPKLRKTRTSLNLKFESGP
jgi:hypothetical protein